MNKTATTREARVFEHDGSIDWECSACKKEGVAPFRNLKTTTENPTRSDYEPILTTAEVEHAITGCTGRLIFVCAGRYRFVEKNAGR